MDAFWAENARCQAFTTDKPRCAASFSPDDHWIFEFMQVPSTVRYYHDKAYRDDLHREVNRVTEQYVGQTFFDEDTFRTSPKRIENLFGCDFTYHEGSTPWLTPVTDDPDEFARVLDRAEATDLHTWALPEEFLAEWEERRTAGQISAQAGHGQPRSGHHHHLGAQPGNCFLLDDRSPRPDAPLPRHSGREDGGL